jgi:hypothetical protein
MAKIEFDIPSYLKAGSESLPVGEVYVKSNVEEGTLGDIISGFNQTKPVKMAAALKREPILPIEEPSTIVPVGGKKTYDTEGVQKYSNPAFWQDEIKEIIESFTRTEGMKTAIGPYNMTYLLNSYDQFLDHGGNPEVAKQLQKDIQNFINSYTESFKALPEDKKKERQDQFNKDMEHYKGDFPGTRFDKPGAQKPPVIEKQVSAPDEDIFIG